jgi:hypothetical protein
MSDLPSRSSRPQRGQKAEEIVAQAFANAGWDVRRQPGRQGGGDLLVRRGRNSYIVEVKAGPEGRADRLIPLWAQACLQAKHAAGERHMPLAVVAAPKIGPRAANQVLDFAKQYSGNDVGVGVVDFAGLRLFRGEHLDGLDSEDVRSTAAEFAIPKEGTDLFSDLNQWLLKVLLAPELADNLLAAPRGRYHNASQLARAANVSVMSASRFVRQLERLGYLHESSGYLTLVRRDELFRRWEASVLSRGAKEIPMRFALRREPKGELKRMLGSGRACLGLFAAADALGFGFVHGVPPHVCVQRLTPQAIAAWKNVVPVEPGEPPDLILRQAATPQSLFRGVVRVDGLPVSDVLQVWLDVSSHPSRGREQADLIRQRVVDTVINVKPPRE